MSSETSICPHCQAEIPKRAAPVALCPACDKPLDARTTFQPKTSRSRKKLWGVVSALTLMVVVFEVWLTQGDHASTLLDAMPKGVQARVAQDPPSADPEPKASTTRRKPADPNAVKSSISISNGKGTDKDGPPRPLFALGRLNFPEPGDTDFGLIFHEIFRQSVLMTAREDLGARTRDESLGEATPTDVPAATFELHSIRRTGQPILVSIRRTNDTEGEPLWSAEIPQKDPAEIELLSVVERAGALAREQLPEVLKSLGLESRATPASDTKGTLAEEVERRLNQLTFTEQFAAVRAIHEEIRRQGESPSRIGGLIRGYANLGVLTEFHWNAANRAFKA
ncbi:zinc ribbon domain-containing protein, partial [Singulisphaera rosea]